MNKSVKIELVNHIIDRMNDLELDTLDDLHQDCFNSDYYIIGYYQASQWLKQHNIDPFEAVADVINWERENLGEVYLKPEEINSESIVNKLVYAYGEELLQEFDLDQSPDDLLLELNDFLIEIEC